MRDDEQDLLDNTPDVQENSRLSCQILMSEELDGLNSFDPQIAEARLTRVFTVAADLLTR